MSTKSRQMIYGGRPLGPRRYALKARGKTGGELSTHRRLKIDETHRDLSQESRETVRH